MLLLLLQLLLLLLLKRRRFIDEPRRFTDAIFLAYYGQRRVFNKAALTPDPNWPRKTNRKLFGPNFFGYKFCIHEFLFQASSLTDDYILRHDENDKYTVN